MVCGGDVDIDAVEFFKDIGDVKERQIYYIAFS